MRSTPAGGSVCRESRAPILRPAAVWQITIFRGDVRAGALGGLHRLPRCGLSSPPARLPARPPARSFAMVPNSHVLPPPPTSTTAADWRMMPFQIQFRDEVAAISLMDAQTGTNGDDVDGRCCWWLATPLSYTCTAKLCGHSHASAMLHCDIWPGNAPVSTLLQARRRRSVICNL